MGWGTHTMAGSKPSEWAWWAAASRNAVVATSRPGTSRSSSDLMSCRPHDTHDPQSARASTTASAPVAMSPSNLVVAGLAFVGLANRAVETPRARSRASR